jgi:uncharacterized SAM-binding protein YcdF (DUF218 family)
MGFYIFSKFVIIFFRPLFWVILLPLIALFVRRPRLKKGLIITGICLGFLCSNRIFVNELALAWEPGYVKEGEPLPRIAVVLGGFAEYDASRKTISISEEGERIYKAMELYRRGLIDTIVISGGPASYFGTQNSEAFYARRYLIALGVDSNRVFAESRSMNTHENAINSKILLDRIAPGRPVLIISSAFHIPRALKCFSRQGLKCKGYPVHFISKPSRGYLPGDYVIPWAPAMVEFDQLSKEWIGYFGYWVTGKL